VGVRLPDMSPHRFVGDTRKPGGHLFLADLHGAHKGDAKEILDHHQRLAVKWCRQCFATIPFTDAPMRRDVPDTLATWLKEPDHETAFTTWLQALHKAFGWLG